MSIIACNVRGTNQVYKHKEMKAFYRENNFILLAILENIVKEERAPKIIQKFGDKWRWVAKYNIDRREGFGYYGTTLSSILELMLCTNSLSLNIELE
ncbi:hypothetical protein R3W88_014781 [Solanum pinnatisectum]|uniref:Uncharacterized protein n=1 Tax=Solanum pinnatisectum TaxID=50273 RepID=A0AAV9KU17_9SOLN|nr:hypothetical protein R3W88_014781 [Solanum pinnatisectum]